MWEGLEGDYGGSADLTFVGTTMVGDATTSFHFKPSKFLRLSPFSPSLHQQLSFPARPNSHYESLISGFTCLSLKWQNLNKKIIFPLRANKGWTNLSKVFVVLACHWLALDEFDQILSCALSTLKAVCYFWGFFAQAGRRTWDPLVSIYFLSQPVPWTSWLLRPLFDGIVSKII